jgi:hypothetical protein
VSRNGYLECFDNVDNFFKNIPMPCKNDVENNFHMYMDESHQMDEKFG